MLLKYSTTSSDKRIVTGFFSFEAYGFLRERIFEKSYSAFMLFTTVKGAFALGGSSCRYEADNLALFAPTSVMCPE